MMMVWKKILTLFNGFYPRDFDGVIDVNGGFEVKNAVDDVFGMNRNLPLNYVSRASVDDFLKNNLARKQHLVVYGSSKQGKTSLRKSCLDDDSYIVVHCSNKWGLDNLHEAILKQAGFELTVSSTLATSGKQKIFAKMKVGILGGGAEGGAESERDVQDSSTKAPLELDPLDVNDVVAALESIGFNKYVILEDFHYLSVETQKDFSVSLKAFHENSELSFIIIGVWLEENRLTVYNGDLTGRLLPINADKWEIEELKEVVSSGEALLNISFDEGFKNRLIETCHGSVYIVQEVCYQCCISNGVFSTQPEIKTLGNVEVCDSLLDQVVGQQSGRFNSFLTQFSEGFQDTTLEMHKWLLYPIITASQEQLVEGFTQSEIRRILNEVHPRGCELNSGNVTQSLQSVSSLQIKKDIKPTVLDYDHTNLRLRVVDKSFLIWHARQDKEVLLDLVGLPSAIRV